MNKWLRRPGVPHPIPLKPEDMDEVCSVLAGEFEEPDEVFMSFMVRLPGWARLEFEDIEKMFRELRRNHAPLLDVVRGCRVRVYDERGSLEIDYRRLWLFDSVRIRADAEDKGWCISAIGAAARVLESREEWPLRIDFPVLLVGMLWPAFMAFSGTALAYLWNTGLADVRLLWTGAAACALSAATFAPGLWKRMFPSGPEGETGSAPRRLWGVLTVLSSIAAAAAAILGLVGV